MPSYLSSISSLTSSLDDTPDASLIRSAHEAAGVPSKFGTSPATRPLDPTVQARLRYYEALRLDEATLQAQLVNQLDTYLILDRKAALQRLKTMPVGDIVIVPGAYANHLRVACHYHNRHHAKTIRTETLKVGDNRYLKAMRVQ